MGPIKVTLGVTSPESAKLILEAVEEGALPKTAAGMYGIKERTFYDWLERDPEFAAALYAAHQTVRGQLEARMLAMGMQGDARAAERYLSASEQAGWSNGPGKDRNEAITVIINVDRGPDEPLDVSQIR